MSFGQQAEVEVVRLVQEPAGALVWGQRLDRPEPGIATGPIVVAGWILPRRGAVERVEVRADGHLLVETPLNHRRPDLAEAFPSIADADLAGFRALVDVEDAVDLHVEAVLEEGSRILIGAVQLRQPRKASLSETQMHLRQSTGSDLRPTRRTRFPWRR